MLGICNLSYDSSQILTLQLLLDIAHNIYDLGDIESAKLVLKDGFSYEGTVLSIKDLTNSESKAFYDDLNSLICGFAGVLSIDKLPKNWDTFRHAMLSGYFDMATETKLSKNPEEIAIETQELILERTMVPIEMAAQDIYGEQNILLTLNVEKQFYKELKELLVVDIAMATKHNINDLQVNSRIASYKARKFKRILSYLLTKYPNDEKINSISGMYTNNMLNISDYYYVLNTFKQEMSKTLGLNQILNQEYLDRVLLTNKSELEEYYKQLIEKLKGNAVLLSWFNRKFTTDHAKSQAKILFTGEHFSRSYKLIREAVYKSDNAELKSLIKIIESPKNELLDYVNDYFILTLFDNLLNYKLRDNVRIKKGYAVSAEPLNLVNDKYMLHTSHKHLKKGFESGNDESTDKHTSANVKDILECLYIYEYNREHKLIPTTLNLALINSSWQSLVKDVVDNGATFNSERGNEVKELLLGLLTDTISNIVEVFDLLFKGRYRLIDRIEGTLLLNENHKNVLYSFYLHVLDLENEYSFLSRESLNLNNSSGTKLELTTDLVAILHRNVDNTYLDCDMRTGKLSTLSKFNWDSNLFDLVERISSKSKVMLVNPTTNSDLLSTLISTNDKIYITIGGHQLGYTYGNTSRKIFTTDNKLNIIDGKDSILEELAKINLVDFEYKVNNDLELTENEKILHEFLLLLDNYLDLNILTEEGMKVLEYYKQNHKADVANKLYSKNYLDNFLRNLLRAMEAHNQAHIAKLKGMNLKQYLSSDNTALYRTLYEHELDKASSKIFDFQGTQVYFNPASTTDLGTINFVKAAMLVKGESIKSTIFNKLGATVSNYTVARAGSRVHLRLYELRKQFGASSSLLFVLNPDILDPNPVNDGEITTSTGDVVAVRDLTENELFKHALLDKFYNSYINNDKVCFLPTVYSDKVLFLNYFSKLTFLGENPLKLTNNITKVVKDYYKNTFFATHAKIQESIFKKFEILYKWQNGNPMPKKGTRLESITEYLKTLTPDSLSDLVYRYNTENQFSPISFELDKDYRVVNGRLALNEIVSEYSDIYNNPEALENYFKKQMDLFLSDLKYYGTSFKLFDSRDDMEKWTQATIKDGEIKEKIPYFKITGLLKILSSTKILSLKDRKAYVTKWINKSGELILNIGNEVNPLLEKFFYIEGLLSNNLRLSMTGSEVNHPDKSENLFKTLSNLHKKYISESEPLAVEEKFQEFKDALIKEGIFQEDVDDLTIREFGIELSNKSLGEIKSGNFKYSNELSEIYNKSIHLVINTAQGTQFKRNVIAPATLHNPILGLIEGMSNTVKVAVIKDMKAPVNNLRYSDSIDSLDGSARMTYAQMKLENNGLGDLKVGTNRKPIWDAQTSDVTSFLAKFASFVITNSSMRSWQDSTASDYKLFKKMHNLRWRNSIDITKSIYDVEKVKYSDSRVEKWFKDRILEGKRLFYKNKYDLIIEITGFGRDAEGYFTKEKLLGSLEEIIVHHYFDAQSKHYTQPVSEEEGGHTIDSLYELFVAMGGVETVDANGEYNEMSQEVLTNFIINVGHKKDSKPIKLAKDVVQPLKSLFVAYALNTSAVKNGAQNVNNASRWTDDNELNTFTVTTGGLGILLNADHDVINSELTEFSLVIAACSAYGKVYPLTDELYYGLAQSAFLASEKELDNIKYFLTKTTKDPEKAKYDLYRIVAKLIIKSNSNSEFDLTDLVKYEVNKILADNKDVSEDSDTKLPFSDPSLYTQFITSITSVINKKSIKRQHPGAAYVMAPSYNLVQYYQIYDKGEYKRYMFLDVVRKAKKDFKTTLKKELSKVMDPEEIKYMSFDYLVLNALEKLDISTIPYLQITTEDLSEYNKALVLVYMNSLLLKESYRTMEWFMPTDIVYVTREGAEPQIFDLSDMKDYYNFKNREWEEGTKFLLCVTKPSNLKPSFIRWRYAIDKETGNPVEDSTAKENIIYKYMNIYDHPIIRNSWNNPDNKPKQAEIQLVLDLLDLGKFILNGKEINIVPGSLENTEAEIVLGNMYKETFNTGNKSLADILEQGEKFFLDLATDDIQRLPEGFYHLALMKSNGKHTLISLDKALDTGLTEYNENYLYLVNKPFDINDEYINENLEIYNKKGGVKIGKYIESDWEYKDGIVVDKLGLKIDSDKYKLVNDEDKINVTKVYERIDFVKRFSQQNSSSVNNNLQVFQYDLYLVADIRTIARSFNRNFENLGEKEKTALLRDASNLVASIIESLYELDDYIDVRINPGRIANKDNKVIRLKISNYLSELGKTKKEVNKKQVNMSPEELLALDVSKLKEFSNFEKYMIKVRLALLKDDFNDKYSSIYENYYKHLGLYKKRYTSFLNSLYFISSRIPAQSLQSFMPMKCVGWTGDSSNTAYVSYILTFLLGSDYDIDKAYIMGQSFDDGVYIGWSNFFDYSNIRTLLASKTLPVPRNLGYVVSVGQNFNIDAELNSIIETKDKEQKIRLIASLIRKINNNKGKYNYDNNSEEKAALVRKLVKHDTYKVKNSLREQSYKNSASANIFNIVHNIRNRDLAYSDITMRDLRKSSDSSPKGIRTKQLNMINPLTKYIMLRQNLVGKDVIGIAANGEKDWFNITYTYHNILRNGNAKDLTYILMNKEYTRIKGRAKNRITTENVKHIPDLWWADSILASRLKLLFYDNDFITDNATDKYVDLLISQLLSAATDNAKELILHKINAGTNLAKYHIHLMMMGFSLDDIVAFMTCPVVELIDKYSKSDIYTGKSMSVSKAILLLKGNIEISDIIVNPYDNLSPELAEEYANYRQELANLGIQETGYSWIIKEIQEAYNQSNSTSLKNFFNKYLRAKLGLLTEKEESLLFLKDYKLPETDNFNTNYVFKYINNIIDNVNNEILEYNKNLESSLYTSEDFFSDLDEFVKISEEADETSKLASVWLKLNQGIPLTDEELIKLMKNMKGSVLTRELKFSIHKIIKTPKKFKLLENDSSLTEEEIEEYNKELLNIEKHNRDKKDLYINALLYILEHPNVTGEDSKEVLFLRTLIANIEKNNPAIARTNEKAPKDYIINVLKQSIEHDIYGNFDLYKFLSNERVVVPEGDFNTRVGDTVEYRELAADYYNLIKASWNILDIVNRVPTYSKNLDLSSYTTQIRHLFANKALLVDELLDIPELRDRLLSKKEYKLVTQYADKIIITSFFLSLNDPIDISIIKDSKIYNSKYDLYNSDTLYINNLTGIDSLKYFVENYLVQWLLNNKKYKDNALVKGLSHSSYFGKAILRTKLDLSKINDSMLNKKTYNAYLLGFQELSKEKVFGNYSIADIIVLYNLALNGTKIGSRFLTSVFKNSVVPGTKIHDYYKFLGNNDYKSIYTHLFPTKRDFLIAIAPVVGSVNALSYRTEPYVKVLNPMRGFDVYKRDSKGGYNNIPEVLIDLGHDEIISEDEKNNRLYNYSNSLTLFPLLHRLMNEKSIFNIIDTESSIQDLETTLSRYIKEYRLLIYKNC